MNTTVKEIIKRNFSRCAEDYDGHAEIQRRSARRLIDRTAAHDAKSILDIGCGTGIYTELLRQRFPRAKIKAVDISPEMVEVAKKKLGDREINFVTADAEEVDIREKFDLITSNSSFQWFTDLPQALSRYKALLNPRGLVSFATFGPRTFCELDEALKSLKRASSISSNAFPEKEKIENMVSALFREGTVEECAYEEKYDSLADLLRSIKYTGARGNGDMKGFWTPGAIRRIEKRYREKFYDIRATYEILICRGSL